MRFNSFKHLLKRIKSPVFLDSGRYKIKKEKQVAKENKKAKTKQMQDLPALRRNKLSF